MSEEFDDISEATAHVAIDVDKQTTVVHYSRLFNLGNYENEKIGITLEVVPGQAVQDVIKAAEDEVNKQAVQHRDIRSKIQEAQERLWDIERKIQVKSNNLAELEATIKALEETNPEAVKEIEAAHDESDDDLVDPDDFNFIDIDDDPEDDDDYEDDPDA